ncbi:MAG: maleylacetoacetate isomerase [Phyllobacteriaceae bacterium]|nr:maleylacetoacetate isomerase [Phyllobacteriaceae bacterium]
MAESAPVILYDYWRSSASFRARIALNLAGVAYESSPVDLLKNEQKSAEHLARNPQGLVPALFIDGHLLTQSLAIIEYLDETRGLNLLPAAPLDRARVRAVAYAIAMDIHPVCNTGVINQVTELTGEVDATRLAWMHKFIGDGLAAVETLLAALPGPFCFGDRVTLADICLAPQVYNARRWGVSLDAMPRVAAAELALSALPAFSAARPVAPG